MTDELDKEIDEELFRMWGGGIDYALSPDFKDLSDDEKDALYERYKTNLAKTAKKAIQSLIDQECTKARIDELEKLASILPIEPPKGNIAIFDTGRMYQETLKHRLAELSNKENK